MKPVGVRDPATGWLSSLKLTGAPYTFSPVEGARSSSHCSTAMFEVAAFGGMKITVQQAPDAPAEFWKPGQIEIDLIGVRALRDACNLFLDRFHDNRAAGARRALREAVMARGVRPAPVRNRPVRGQGGLRLVTT